VISDKEQTNRRHQGENDDDGSDAVEDSEKKEEEEDAEEQQHAEEKARAKAEGRSKGNRKLQRVRSRSLDWEASRRQAFNSENGGDGVGDGDGGGKPSLAVSGLGLEVANGATPPRTPKLGAAGKNRSWHSERAGASTVRRKRMSWHPDANQLSSPIHQLQAQWAEQSRDPPKTAGPKVRKRSNPEVRRQHRRGSIMRARIQAFDMLATSVAETTIEASGPLIDVTEYVSESVTHMTTSTVESWQNWTPKWVLQKEKGEGEVSGGGNDTSDGDGGSDSGSPRVRASSLDDADIETNTGTKAIDQAKRRPSLALPSSVMVGVGMGSGRDHIKSMGASPRDLSMRRDMGMQVGPETLPSPTTWRERVGSFTSSLSVLSSNLFTASASASASASDSDQTAKAIAVGRQAHLPKLPEEEEEEDHRLRRTRWATHDNRLHQKELPEEEEVGNEEEEDDRDGPMALPPEQAGPELWRVFTSADADHDGTVSKTELVRALHTDGKLFEVLGLPEHVTHVRKSRAVQRYFAHADADSNERLSWEEFVASVDEVHAEITKEAQSSLKAGSVREPSPSNPASEPQPSSGLEDRLKSVEQGFGSSEVSIVVPESLMSSPPAALSLSSAAAGNAEGKVRATAPPTSQDSSTAPPPTPQRPAGQPAAPPAPPASMVLLPPQPEWRCRIQSGGSCACFFARPPSCTAP
jgi:hypothetical protein